METHANKPDTSSADLKAVPPNYIDDKELERRVPAISRATWQTLRSNGQGPAVFRIGRRCVYSWREVVAWLESHRSGGAAAGGTAPCELGPPTKPIADPRVPR